MKFNLGVKRWEVQRESGAWVRGEFVVNATETFIVRGSLQPLGLKEAALMPDAYRSRAKFKLYAAVDEPPLRIAGSVESQGLGDFIRVGSELFLVVAAAEWPVSFVTRRLRSAANIEYVLAAPAGTRA